MYSAAVVILKSTMSRDAGSVPSVLGVTLAALKRTTSGTPVREISTEARAVLREGVELTSQACVETVTEGCWVLIAEDALSRFDCVREIREMCVKPWEAKMWAFWMAIPGPEPTMSMPLWWAWLSLGVL